LTLIVEIGWHEPLVPLLESIKKARQPAMSHARSGNNLFVAESEPLMKTGAGCQLNP
jgi:hypothetical protein